MSRNRLMSAVIILGTLLFLTVVGVSAHLDKRDCERVDGTWVVKTGKVASAYCVPPDPCEHVTTSEFREAMREWASEHTWEEVMDPQVQEDFEKKYCL